MTQEDARKIAAEAGAGQQAPSAPPADEAPAQTPAPELAANSVTINMSAPMEVTTEPAAVLDPAPEATKTEAFTMRDDPDLELTDKELDMVVKAVGLKNKKAKKKK